MNHKIIRTITALTAATALLTTACAAEPEKGPMAEAVWVKDQWANAADTGMAAVFGSIANTGAREVRIVGGTSPQAGTVEIHEVVADDSGAKTMRQKEGGLAIPAGEARELIPGGDHLMLMDLTEPLLPGADVEVTLRFEDGSTLPVTAQVRDFAGGNEEYAPDGHHHGDEGGGGHHHG
ncbi:copper chaperone PCu(A)C [Mycolicibacterium phlei]|jgi:copper(I)-binding protein|uniref:copper chaperone PCu(A)C n=1 Tax=Mycolicibacterium phlei TaxID=1771 RepID=UPI00025AE071|nr:copper chaperone PCu(A)C [Mycolicibacterium phlei]EID16113.1 copper(I)-binding protein [Mycolicibacterium phlei RIVM601174]MBF4195103.1 copper(I)-binding protein [Mycolicibacterium phlei]